MFKALSVLKKLLIFVIFNVYVSSVEIITGVNLYSNLIMKCSTISIVKSADFLNIRRDQLSSQYP